MVLESSEFLGKVYLLKLKAGFGLSHSFTQSASHLPQELVVEQVQIALANGRKRGVFWHTTQPLHWKWVKLLSVATDWGQSPPRCCSVRSLRHLRISLSNIADDQLQGWLLS